MKRISWFILLCALMALFAAPALAAGPFYVTTTGAGNKDGSAWDNAFGDIQSAIDEAYKAGTATDIYVAKGTYKLESSLLLKKYAKLYGGFAGTEASLEERDLTNTANATTLTAASGKTITIIRCFGLNSSGAMYSDDDVDKDSVYSENLAATNDTRLDGFIITGGKGALDTGGDTAATMRRMGGGMLIRKTSPTIANCTFKGNSAIMGGAISIGSGTPKPEIINCRFEENTALISPYTTATNMNGQLRYGHGGGAIIITSANADVKVTDCTFIGNSASRGGAIHIHQSGAKVTVTNCTFTGNKAVVDETLNTDTVALTVNQEKNSSTVSNSYVTGKYKIYQGMGGGIFAWGCTEGNVKIVNSTFFNNVAPKGGTEIYNASRYAPYNFDAETTTTDDDNLTKTAGHVSLLNTFFWNDSSEGIRNEDESVITATTCAVNSAVTLTGAVTASTKPTEATAAINGVTHTVYKLLAAATNLITKGTADNAPKTDQLGMARAATPSIGAVEYLEVAVSTSTLPSGTVSSDYKQTLEATVNPTQDASLVSWDIESGNLPGGIKLIGDVISGTPTEAGSFDITVRVTVGVYEASKDLTLVINEAAKASPDIGTVSITVKNAVGSNTAAFSVTSADVKLTTASNDLTAGVKVNATAYKVSSSDATPVFSVNAGNATLKAAYMGDTNSDWTSTSDLNALTISDLTAISGQEAVSETSPDYYRFQFCVSDDYYFTLELSVLLSGEPEAKVTSDEVTSGSVSEPTETFTIGDETYYRVPANGSDNLVTKNASGVWQLPRVISFAIMGGFNNFKSMMRTIERTIAQIVTGIFQPNSDGLFTNIGAELSTPVHPGTIFIIRLAPSGWRLPFMTGFERGAMRVARVEDGVIFGAMTVQNSEGNDSINEEITTLNIDTSDLRDPDDSSVKVPVPEGAYAISYSTLNGEVYGAFSDDIAVAAANYTPDDDGETTEVSSHGGSSGCNAGFGLFALAALALAFRKFSK